MIQDKIKSVKLNRFRGAAKPLQLDFDSKKSMVMIFGENGTGKSTIIDALDFVFNKKCGSLKEKSSTNIRNHLPALGSTPQDVEVSVETQQRKEWKGKLSGSKPEVERNNNILSVKILRRDKILKLINAEPKKRYEALKDFIELPNIRSSESYLRDLIKRIKKDLEQDIKNSEYETAKLKKIWEDKRRPESDFLKWAEGIRRQNTQKLQEKIKKSHKFIDLTHKPLECRKEAKKLRENYVKSRKEFNESERILKDLSEKNQPEEVIDILQKTQSFLQKEKTAEECPACEQAIVPENLQKRISERLQNMQQFVEAKNQRQKAKKDYESAQEKLSEKEQELRQSIEKLIKYSEQEKEIEESKQITENFIQNNFLSEGQIESQKAEIFFKNLTLSFEKMQKTFDSDNEILNQSKIIKISLHSLEETEHKIKNLDGKGKYLSKILKIVENERKLYVEGMLKQISEDIEKLYLKLHPEEGLGKIKLFLKPRVQGSLEISGNFQNIENVPPQAYYSDSHLDTLGICVFIAMAKYFKDDIIVLDDVVTSLDQQHLDRFIKTLHDESRNFSQIILTTHYRLWREKYKFSRLPNSDIQLIELSTFWSLDQGIRSSQTKLSIEELEALKNQYPFDRQIAGSKTGVFLESLLDHLSLLYELRLPRRSDSKYTLGELMNCFSKKFIEQMKIKKESGELLLLEIMNSLFELKEPIRSQVGCHFNTSGMGLSDKQTMSFLDRTIELGKALICPQCKGLPEKKKTDCWKCSCRQTGLYPLHK